jgi:ABC-type phosphate transport system substrate-binding protein
MSSVLTSKGIAVILIALLAGIGVGGFIIAPIVTSGNQQTQSLITSYISGGNLVPGTISIYGSTTVYPVSLAEIPHFQTHYPFVTVTATATGSGDGYAKVIGGAPIAAASREPSHSEIQQAQLKGVHLELWSIGADALCVIYNPPTGATFTALNLTRADVQAIFQGAGSLPGWSPVNWDTLTLINGTAPPVPVTIFIRGDGSGTRGDFESSSINGFNISSSTPYTGITREPSNQAMLNDVKNTPGSMGYVGLAYAYQGGVQQVSIARVAFYNWSSPSTNYSYFVPSKTSVVAWATASSLIRIPTLTKAILLADSCSM